MRGSWNLPLEHPSSHMQKTQPRGALRSRKCEAACRWWEIKPATTHFQTSFFPGCFHSFLFFFSSPWQRASHFPSATVTSLALIYNPQKCPYNMFYNSRANIVWLLCKQWFRAIYRAPCFSSSILMRECKEDINLIFANLIWHIWNKLFHSINRCRLWPTGKYTNKHLFIQL